MFFAGAWGYLQLLKLPVPPGQANALPAGGGSLVSNSTVMLAMAALIATAVLAGVLAVVRWFSPLAPGLPGLLLLAWTALYLVSVQRAVSFIPLRSHSFGAGWEALLFNGILGAVGAVLVFPMFIPSRWREPRRAAAEEFTADVDDYLTTVATDDRPRRREERAWEARETREEASPLVGTVVGGPVVGGPLADGRPAAGGMRPVDTTRVTGASRALRSTGSFRLATGSQPRATGSFRAAQDTSMLGRPYYQAGDE
jgi:hypothetical protein